MARQRHARPRVVDASGWQQFVEDFGLFYEAAGIPRMAGRILGALVVADAPGHLSLPELKTLLHASTGSISTMTRLLEQSHLIERLAVPRDRTIRVRINGEHWGGVGHIERDVQKAAALAQLGSRLLLEPEHAELWPRVGGMVETAQFWSDALPRAFDRWRAEHELPPIIWTPRAPAPTVASLTPAAFVDGFATLMEENGLPHMAGRILGFLLVAPEPEQSLVDLAQQLGASKGSISTMARLLRAAGAIERVGTAGSRRTYVRVSSGVWNGMMDHAPARARDLERLADAGRALLSDPEAPAHRHIDALAASASFWSKAVPELVAAWRARSGDDLPAAR